MHHIRFRALRVWALKRRAKRHYLAYKGTRAADGGNHITNVITGGRLDYHAQLFNVTLDRLAELGEPVPEARL